MTSQPGQLLFAFVRHWSRRALTGDTAITEQGRLVLATEAVEAVTSRTGGATVNGVARELGIDQSGASRLITTACDAGYLVMVKGSADGRRREVSITPKGRGALGEAHAWQEQVFAELTVDWSSARRESFARAMADLIARSHEGPPGSSAPSVEAARD
jgi:DNA-binding MarR family transcriptional regulator